MKVKRSREAVYRLPQEQRVASILAAARLVIAEKGYENTSMSDIANNAGVVEGTLYRFFKTKQELLIRVAEEWFEEQLTEDSGLESIRGTWNKLRHLIWHALMTTRRQPALSRFLLTEIRPNPAYRQTKLFQLNRRYTGEIRHLCQRAIEEGEFRDDVAASLLRDMVFGCIEHRTWAFLRGEGDFSVDEVADGIANVLYRGMAAKPDGEAVALADIAKRLERIETLVEQGQPRASRISKAATGWKARR